MESIVFLDSGFDIQKHLWYDKSFTTVSTTDKPCIYPVLIDEVDINTYSIPSFLDLNKTKLLFIQAHECGFVSESGKELIWMSKLALKHKISKEDLILVTSDHLIESKFNKLLKLGEIVDNFTVKAFTYFKNTLWFHDYNKKVDEIFKLSLENNRNRKKLHFLNFNRATRKHRVCIFGELMTNPNFTGKFITSLGHNVRIDNVNYVKEVDTALNSSYTRKKQLLEFFKDYNTETHYIYDEVDLERDKGSNLNVEAHNQTFVNIVTESSYEENFIFLTEKTFKPIYCAQPFILIGNPHSLKKLKELGFKTFSEWWDESYDEEMDFTKRFEKVVKVMEDISSWSLDKCLEVTEQMEDVFIDNFNILINKTEQEEVKKLLLNFNKSKIEKRII